MGLGSDTENQEFDTLHIAVEQGYPNLVEHLVELHDRARARQKRGFEPSQKRSCEVERLARRLRRAPREDFLLSNREKFLGLSDRR